MQQQLLQNYSDMEKGAYLGAIASIATADHSATEKNWNTCTPLPIPPGFQMNKKT